MKIPGSFYVVLKSNRKIIAKRAFFQPTNPDICSGCSEKTNISLDFVVPSHQVVGKNLDVEVELVRKGARKERLISSKLLGNLIRPEVVGD